jgi:mRNA degradation ribonuclease J1/J2
VKPGKELLFCALGGSGEIGMNVNLYGCDGKWLMVDLGMTFGADPNIPAPNWSLPISNSSRNARKTCLALS